MSKKAILLLAEGFEEVEATTPMDFLRRAGIEVIVAAIGENKCVKGAHGIAVCADVSLEELVKQGKAAPDAFDAVVVPGGMPGASNLAASREAGSLLTAMAAAGKPVCAICASPAVVLSPLGLLKGRKYTCYPGYEKDVKDGIFKEEAVVLDGNLITSRAPGTAALFALAIISLLVGEAEAKKIKDAALL